MSEPITITPLNAARVRIDADMGVYNELYGHFAYRPEGYKFMPAYKNKQWDGFIRLFDVRTRTLPVGLLPRLKQYAEDSNIPVEESITINTHASSPDVTFEDVYQFAKSLNVYSDGKKIELHDYQIEAVLEGIQQGRLVALAPTSAGKSLILYTFLNWHFQKNPEIRMLLIVPSVQLVLQMYDDFLDYQTMPAGETTTAFSVVNDCLQVSAGKEKSDITKRIAISTWQSLNPILKAPYANEYFAQWGLVAVDECHGCKGKVLQNLLDRCVNAHIRIGVTGTLDGTDFHQILLEGLFGRVNVVTTTKELMDMGAVSQMDIKMLVLQYSEETRKKLLKAKYDVEYTYLTTLPKRIKLTANLALSLKGNTLILVKNVESHANPIYEHIQKKLEGSDRKLFIIHGNVDGDVRNDIRQIVNNEENAIIVATYGCMSTGVSIKRLHNIIFASPSKSQIRVLQSVGRGLRLGKDKTHCTLYDIADDLSVKKHQNHTLKHAVERIKMYSKQQFDYKIIKMDMPD